MSDKLNKKKCSICNKFEQSFEPSPLLMREFYNYKETSMQFELLTPHAPKEIHQEITSLCQELNALDEKVKLIRKDYLVLLEDFYQKKLNKSFIKSLIDYLEEKGDESTINDAICKLCGQELVQQEELINKKLEEIGKGSTKLWDKSNLIRKEIQKKVEREKFIPIFEEAEQKLIKEILAELKSLLEKSSESAQQNSKPQLNQPKPTNYTPWIVGGVIGVGATAGLVIWLVIKKKNAKN